MSLHFCKSFSSCLYKNVCFTMRNPGLLSGRFPRQSGVHFVFFLLLQRVKSIILLSRRQDRWLGSYVALLRLHNAPLQASVYFIPIRSHCCTEGIFFLFRLIILRNANVKQSTFRVDQDEHSASAVDLELWVRMFLPENLDERRDFLSSFKSPACVSQYPSVPVLLCGQT